MSKVWFVKFQSYNQKDYVETVSGKDEREARKNANRMTVKHDDRDKILSIEEDPSHGLEGYPHYTGK